MCVYSVGITVSPTKLVISLGYSDLAILRPCGREIRVKGSVLMWCGDVRFLGDSCDMLGKVDY